jgi:anti-sigma28 factor (negative regulator of flagellin synthesis)
VFKSSLIKKSLVAAVAVVALAAGAVGIAAAQAQPAPNAQMPTQNPREAYLAALANRLNVTVDQLKQAIQGARQDARSAAPGTPHPRVGRGGAFPGGGLRGRGGAFGGALRLEANAIAKLFNENTGALRQELPGNTLAELAAKHNVKVDDVVSTIVQTADQQLDQAAQKRNISADRVSQIKQQISERAQQFVSTHRFPARGSGTRS